MRIGDKGVETADAARPVRQHKWDPDVEVLIARMEAAGVRPLREQGVARARQVLESIPRPPGPDMSAVTDAAAESSEGPVPLRIYRPHQASATGAPALVWFHGGGMIMGSLDSFDRLAREIAAATGCVIVNVDYRLAPEHSFPAGNDDAYTALIWTHQQARELGLDPTRIGVGGDSAGGGLAASTALRSRNEGGPSVAQQVMFYPGLERRRDRPSMREFGDSPFLTAEDIDWMKDMYLGPDASLDDQYGTPALADDLSGVAPAIIAVGSGDPLRDGVEEYGTRLRDAGVPTAQLRYPGVGHGFVMQTAALARARSAVTEVGALVAARFRVPV
ncbi:alpha/beta hydrolase [Gordonia terrae]|uniref:Alpha/beta hydrolase n=2 Tax=Gordonia terrae TaxID=2055 RepID=A0AAD0NWT0_9ACTN|nr:alpha/beta hydrolase [Gordonia terrae]VTR09642.1 lipase [Clostridioides difficile]ANY22249.1 lipase [Gordonia terrae]AWO82988.1 alpha/beta hydrolase [Gordonia terrae]VTS30551.1 Acetyl esterase [Gordonia terrae]GAB46278.1 putative esterase [Gordonia terrae NBRC 100016]